MGRKKDTILHKGVVVMDRFVPEKQEKTTTSIRLPEKTMEEIDRRANIAGISRNEFIKQCIDYALSRM